ncbi:blue copper protein 1a-like [Magnolia sinica]|uniref:blue copper protein 1a-like n=1 Tax=Magnolia sinica TaxID=86752 RepID=UPI00265A4E8E|nr:blue copper protein 1a-like [Magnolia sinica]
MASKQMYALAIIMAILPAIALAKEFVVGDGTGWTFNFDYQAWAAGKDFRVGDKLVFKYPAGAHNVFKVNGTAFQDCTVPPVNEALITGNDIITLATPGRKWYICGVAKHCANGGQKLAITVQSNLLAPSLPPIGAEAPSLANEIMASKYQVLMVGAVAIAAMLITV